MTTRVAHRLARECSTAGACSVRFDDGEERTLWPATDAMMALEEGP